ncbi:MAG: DUF3052 domain-containing protein [Gemmatimonadetes bacterium]|nr:DUF3052 domain-containing protein [Gemmatimonadota bacterium]
MGLADAGFVAELKQRAARVATRAVGRDYDLIFYRANEPAALSRLAALRERIQSGGAIWLVTPKGRPEIGHGPVVAAAKKAGLIDVKTARYSDALTAMKLMIPRAQRR